MTGSYDATEKIPNGPTTKLFQEIARKYKMVCVVPIYEVEITGVYYNTAAVIDADGKYLGKYRKSHIPQVQPGFWEKYYFKPGNLGYPCFDTAYARIGVYICYDRHFPEGARALGLNGAEIIFNPSATVAGLSEYLWKLEQPAHAVANGYFVGAINRVGKESPWNIGEFYGQSYFCDPRGQMLKVGSRDQDELVTADLDMDMIKQVRETPGNFPATDGLIRMARWSKDDAKMTNVQNPNPNEAPNPNAQHWGLGHWDLIGICDLVLRI